MQIKVLPLCLFSGESEMVVGRAGGAFVEHATPRLYTDAVAYLDSRALRRRAAGLSLQPAKGDRTTITNLDGWP